MQCEFSIKYQNTTMKCATSNRQMNEHTRTHIYTLYTHTHTYTHTHIQPLTWNAIIILKSTSTMRKKSLKATK